MKDYVLIQIVSETEPDMAVLLHVTPVMPRKPRHETGLEVISSGILSLHTGKTMCTHSEELSLSRNSVDRLTDITVVWLGRKFSVKQ